MLYQYRCLKILLIICAAFTFNLTQSPPVYANGVEQINQSHYLPNRQKNRVIKYKLLSLSQRASSKAQRMQNQTNSRNCRIQIGGLQSNGKMKTHFTQNIVITEPIINIC